MNKPKKGKYATKNPYQESELCMIPKLNISCFGCCGHDFTSKKEILKRIEKNTKELGNYDDLVKFRDRSQDISKCGICKNIIFNKDNTGVLCPLHPKIHGFDLREGYCQIDHLCLAAKTFNKWDKKTKTKLMKFIKDKVKEGMDWYDYSRNMDDDSLLKEFLVNS